ncbi:MAG: PQQ-dependent sugar dehydrogenase [Cyclobacteriaceae bacterium]
MKSKYCVVIRFLRIFQKLRGIFSYMAPSAFWSPLLILLLVFTWFPIRAQDGETLYKTYCAGCHGANLEGNSASTLIKTDWKYGRTSGLMTRNITYGIPGTEMIGWNQVLDGDQIKSLVSYISRSQKIHPNRERPVPETIETSDYTLKVEEWVETRAIRTPWAIEFTSKDSALISERRGVLRWIVKGEPLELPVVDVPQTQEFRTGGYMDIAIDPEYKKNGWIYLALSYAPKNITDNMAPAMTKIVRGQIANNKWINEQVLFEVPDNLLVTEGNRWGSRLLFDQEGYLYFSIGDMNYEEDALDPSKPVAKIYRINADGTVPKDNPFISTPGALAQVYTIGNRNVQGISQHPKTGDIWFTEHGPMGGDELNILQKGGNYGWPVITYGLDYDGSVVSGKTEQKGMLQPVVHWTPSIAVCAAEFCNSNTFPKWKNELFVGALAFEEVRKLSINKKNEVIAQEMILKGYGRVRDLKFGPDGALYVVLNQPDKILRITRD